MIDQTALITYVAIVLRFIFIPGPATLLSMSRASTSGTRVGVARALVRQSQAVARWQGRIVGLIYRATGVRPAFQER